ncbi:MAG: hypothetical protein AAGN66_12225 [Acidobacteriota bacterium]
MPPRLRPSQLAPIALATVLLSGCSTSVTTRSIDPTTTASQVRRSVLTSPETSADTGQLLRMFALGELAKRDPVAAIRRLARIQGTTEMAPALTARRIHIAMAELAIKAARDADPQSAAGLHLCAAHQAAEALGSSLSRGAEAGLDPTPRAAADLYNFAVSRLITHLQTQVPDVDGPGGASWSFEGPFHRFHLRFGDTGLWRTDDFELRPADGIEVNGLRNRFRTRGLGAPVVAVRKELPEKPDLHRGFFPSYEYLYPLTARLRFAEDRPGEGGGACCLTGGAPVAAVLDLHDPLSAESAPWRGLSVPLETDFTAPLAVLLDVFEVDAQAVLRAVRAERFLDETGLYLLEPYRPDKIPVVLIHGFQATGATWRDVFNDLRGDPLLRDRYQLWVFNYASGAPFTYSARLLRRSLDMTRARLDPQGRHAAFDRMVVVSHSMGGLLSRLLVTETEDKLWRSLTEEDLEDLDLESDEVDLLREMYFVDPLPFVRRVVFIATPHRGSTLADGVLGRIGESLVRFPQELIDLSQKMLEHIGQIPEGAAAQAPAEDGAPEALPLKRRLPASTGGFSTKDPILQTLAELPIAPKVKYHTIVGDRSRRDDEGTDGLVPHASSHVEGAASVRVIPAGHNVHQHPVASAEIRRILMEHLRREE